MSYAGFRRRFGAFVVDAVLLFVLSVLLSLIGLPMFSTAEYGGQAAGTSAQWSFNVEYSPTGLIIVFAVRLPYYALLEASAKQGTPVLGFVTPRNARGITNPSTRS